MGAKENTQIVKDAYAALGRGDIPGLLFMLTEDVEWIMPGTGLPLSGTYTGRDGVANFFQLLAGDSDILAFEPRTFVAEGDRVLVLGYNRSRLKSNGREISIDWVMSFTVRDSRISHFREFNDTQAIAAAYGSAARAAG